MGMADLVPGVSGGTIAFIAGIYDPLLNSLSALSGEGLACVRRGEFKLAWKAINGPFLLALGAGILTAVVTLAAPLHWLLEHEPVMLRAFFTGLVAASVPLVGRHLSPWNAQAWVWGAVGCAVAGFVTSLPPLVQSTSALWLMGSGMLAICAMLLPGISGSFLLLILGAYAPVLSAIKSFDVAKIAAFGVGAVLGLLAFSRGIEMVARHPQTACPRHPHRVFGGLPSSVVALERRRPPVVHPQRRPRGMAFGQRLSSAWGRVGGCGMDVPRGRRGVGNSPLGRGEQAGFLTVVGVKRLGLIGHPVGHSQSPRLFAARFERLGRHDLSYEAFDLPDISTFPSLVPGQPRRGGTERHRSPQVRRAALPPQLGNRGRTNRRRQHVGAHAQGMGGAQHRRLGVQALHSAFLKNTHERALVLGTGGSAAAVIWALQDLGIDVVAVSRSGRSSEGKRPRRRARGRLRRTQPRVDSAPLVGGALHPGGHVPQHRGHGGLPHLPLGRGTPRGGLGVFPPKTSASRGPSARGGGAQRPRHAQVAGRQGLGNLGLRRGFDLVASQYF